MPAVRYRVGHAPFFHGGIVWLVFAEALIRNLYLFASDVGDIQKISAGVPGVEIFHMDDWNGMKNAVRTGYRKRRYKYDKPPTTNQGLIDRYHPASIARAHVKVYEEVLASR